MQISNRLALLALLAGLLAACGGGGGDDTAAPAGPGPAAATTKGRFIDAPVANLGYTCGVAPNQTSGVTDGLGQYDFVPGTPAPICTFKVGAVVLGTATAGAVLTPYSLVPGSSPGANPAPAANTTVANIARFLQSIDSDGNPANGITIQAETNTALGSAAAGALSFSSPGFDAAAAALIAGAIPERTLVSPTAATNAMNLTLLGLYAGAYACTYSGVVNGTNTVLGTVAVTLTDDVLTGTGTPTYPAGVQHATFDIDGSLTPAGISNSSTSTGATFAGNFTSDGTVAGTKATGTWNDPQLGSGTWSCQHQ